MKSKFLAVIMSVIAITSSTDVHSQGAISVYSSTEDEVNLTQIVKNNPDPIGKILSVVDGREAKKTLEGLNLLLYSLQNPRLDPFTKLQGFMALYFLHSQSYPNIVGHDNKFEIMKLEVLTASSDDSVKKQTKGEIENLQVEQRAYEENANLVAEYKNLTPIIDSRFQAFVEEVGTKYIVKSILGSPEFSAYKEKVQKLSSQYTPLSQLSFDSLNGGEPSAE